MINASKIALAFILGCAINQAVMADESSTTETHANGSGATTNKYKASSGPGGAKVSHTKTNVQANGDGSVSATKQHESHAIGAGGSTHHKSASATTVNPDGSSSAIVQQLQVSPSAQIIFALGLNVRVHHIRCALTFFWGA